MKSWLILDWKVCRNSDIKKISWSIQSPFWCHVCGFLSHARIIEEGLTNPCLGLFSLSVDQLACANFTLLGQGLVHSGSASWGDLGWVFSDGWCVSLFPWWVPILYMESTVSPLLLHWTSYKAAALIHLRSQAMLNWSLQSRGWGLQSLSVLLPIPTAFPGAPLPLARWDIWSLGMLSKPDCCLNPVSRAKVLGLSFHPQATRLVRKPRFIGESAW